MKHLDDHTNEELVALTDEQIEHYCDLACAEAGVPFLPPEPVEPVKPEVKCDLTLMSLRWHGFYMTPGHAAKVLEAIASETIYKQGGEGDYHYSKPISESDYEFPELRPESFVDRSTYDSQQKEIEQYGVEKKQYDRDKREFDRIFKEREGTVSWIYERISDASRFVRFCESARISFKRYLQLANNDATVAMNFMLKASTDLTEDEYHDLIEELVPGFDIQGFIDTITSPIKDGDEDEE